MAYKYEMHAHTKEGSLCSNISAADLVAFYKRNQYDGVCITDHLTGNTTVPRGTLWRERIQLFYSSYELACNAAEKIGLSVFWGPEFSHRGNDFLLFGLEPSWWLEQEGFFDLGLTDALTRFRDAGGFVIHAHPFARAQWIDMVRLPGQIDAVETINGGSTYPGDEMAAIYAERYGYPATGGSDTHCDCPPKLCGVRTDTPCDTLGKLIEAIREGRAQPFSQQYDRSACNLSWR